MNKGPFHCVRVGKRSQTGDSKAPSRASEKLKGAAPSAPLGRIAFGEAIHRGAKRRPPGASRRSTVRSGSQSAFEHPHGTSPSSKALRKDPRAFSPPSKETHPKLPEEPIDQAGTSAGGRPQSL